MRNIIFFIIALVSVGGMLQAREMSPEEAREREQIVVMGGD